jgi:hypothetical protein
VYNFPPSNRSFNLRRGFKNVMQFNDLPRLPCGNTIIVDVPLPYMEVRKTQCGKANNTIIGLNDLTVPISDFIGNYRPLITVRLLLSKSNSSMLGHVQW